MKILTVFALVLIFALGSFAQENNKTEAKTTSGTFKEVKIDKSHQSQPEKVKVKNETVAIEKSAAKIEVVTNDQVKSSKIKESPAMGSAKDSGPAEEIAKMNVQRTATDEDLRNALGDPNPVKKRELE